MTEERRSLEKVMTLKDYVSLGLGTMVGISWVVYAGVWIEKGGPLGAILGFVLGGSLLIYVGKCYAELTPAIPVSGGGMAFAYKAFGTGTGFFVGWLLAFLYINVNPFLTVAIGWLFEYVFPFAKTPPLYTVGGYAVTLSSFLSGAVVALVIIVMNFRGAKLSARFQTYSTGLMLICAAVFVVLALIKGSFSNLIPLFAGEGTLLSSLSATVAVVAIVPYFMAGFDTISQAAEESGKKMNPRDLGKAIIISIAAGFVFYTFIILAISLCLPWKEAITYDMPTATVFKVAFGYDWAAKLVLFTAFLGLITSLNGCVLAGSRVLFALSRGGLISKWFGGTSDKYHTPKNALLIVGGLTLAGPFVGRSLLTPVVNVGSLAFMAAGVITCYAVIALRKKAPDMIRPYKIRYRSTMFIGVVISFILVLLLVVPKSPSQLRWPVEYLIFSAWLLFGFIAFRLRQRKKDMNKKERDYQILGIKG
ncbi:MAG: APC family permease [Candidatus Aminicenantes bacterium]|nr:APC family permease [Candidatus Aminicenantes bacterium]